MGGYDKRKIVYKGWIELETFSRTKHASGAFCVMQRDVVRLFLALALGLGADAKLLFFVGG